jgi:ATP-dependent DNA helicase DinG
VRRGDDRGVVAFLDSRMMSARYAGFLQRSLPPFWPTTDRALVLSALERLDSTAADPLPVRAPAARGLGGGSGAASEPAQTRAAADARPVADAPPVARSPRTAVTGGHAWTQEQDEELRDGVDAEATVAELAEHLDLPPDAVTARLNQLDLKMGDM